MIHLVTGKGGVGKSTMAAALALRLAQEGRKTLLVEFLERSYLRHVFQTEVHTEPTRLTSTLSVVRWEGEACLREYLRHLIKVDRVVKMFFDNRIMRALVQAAPALRELALLGKLTSGPRRVGPKIEFDDIVVDAYATGHFRALWRAPMGLAEAIPFGPMGEQSRSIVRVLKDPAETTIHVCMIPEELPVSEGLELARDIQAELRQQPKLMINRWLNSPLSLEELAEFKGHEFADYLSVILERQKQMRAQVDSSGLPVCELPWVFAQHASDKVHQLAKLVTP